MFQMEKVPTLSLYPKRNRPSSVPGKQIEYTTSSNSNFYSRLRDGPSDEFNNLNSTWKGQFRKTGIDYYGQAKRLLNRNQQIYKIGKREQEDFETLKRKKPKQAKAHHHCHGNHHSPTKVKVIPVMAQGSDIFGNQPQPKTDPLTYFYPTETIDHEPPHIAQKTVLVPSQRSITISQQTIPQSRTTVSQKQELLQLPVPQPHPNIKQTGSYTEVLPSEKVQTKQQPQQQDANALKLTPGRKVSIQNNIVSRTSIAQSKQTNFVQVMQNQNYLAQQLKVQQLFNAQNPSVSNLSLHKIEQIIQENQENSSANTSKKLSQKQVLLDQTNLRRNSSKNASQFKPKPQIDPILKDEVSKIQKSLPKILDFAAKLQMEDQMIQQELIEDLDRMRSQGLQYGRKYIEQLNQILRKFGGQKNLKESTVIGSVSIMNSTRIFGMQGKRSSRRSKIF